MKQLVNSTAFYKLEVDLHKQRLYVKLASSWNKQQIAEEYLRDVRKAVMEFSAPFSCLADFSDMKPFTSQAHLQIHLKALALLRSSGMVRSAEVMPEDTRAHEQLLQIAEMGKAKLALFGNAEIAELFLDNSTHEMIM